jgi:hypothetical protein
MKLERELPQRKRAASPNKQIMMKDEAKICKSKQNNDISPGYEAETGGQCETRHDHCDIQDNRLLILHRQQALPELK